MLKRLLAFVVAGTLICGGLPSYASARTIQTTVDKLNVRTGPSLTSSVTTTLPLGTSYTVEKQQGDWLQIRLPSNQIGWVAGWLVKETASTTAPAKPAGSAGTVTQKPPVSGQAGTAIQLHVTVNVYAAPNASQAPIGQISEGDQVTVQSSSNGWSQIMYDGMAAWIQPGVAAQSGNPTTPDTSTNPTAPNPPASLGTIKVNAPAVNLRSMPTTDSDLLTTMSLGTVLTVLGADGDWYQVQTPDGKTGWVANWLVTKPERTVPSTPPTHSPTAKTVTVLGSDTNIRTGPGTNTAILTRVQTGDKLTLVASSGDWYQIKLANGQIGYIASWLVTTDDQPDNSTPIVVKGDELHGKIIVVDPGHGGTDSGATGTSYSTLEKTINLQVALKLRNKLEASGATVIMTRSDDRALTLQQRVDVAITNKANLFVSIHHNTHPNTQTNGSIVFYYNQTTSGKLASIVQNELVLATNYANLQSRFGDYYVLRENPVISILAEVGFLTNPQEELAVRSDSQQDAAAQGLYTGIVKYFASIR
ncbi:N-acetylmuramoyl-L-alanine amidase [Brevibacillus fluminis]|uniref:N-acetylmuramoyl-L-alanine amidase n=1 Tax=Brevibacillus fluminis TaxID=511487 RepID=A0A3M8DRF3_9BACL|nr:SH3 domain-containing protein [Brevibacillus fluminis]RNB90622.1 N-acetylmuramoyl-L-alanine amidase [Brevibacillus fluminis]